MNVSSRWLVLTPFLPLPAALAHGNTVTSQPTILHNLAVLFQRHYPALSRGRTNIWEMVQVAAICSIIPTLWYFRNKQKNEKSLSLTSSEGANMQSMEAEGSNEADTSDPGLLKKHSETKSYTTSRFTYPNIRVFYRQHPQADKLPTEPAPLPLLVFIHGLGGSVAQFHPLLTSLVNLAPCLAIDLPGCGMSKLEPKNWSAYQTDALVELLDTITDEYREKNTRQGVVLIGHSMGASFAAQLASVASSRRSKISEHVVGLVAVCPKADPPSEKDTALFKKLLLIPGPIFNAWRGWDRRGGTGSKSVHRFVGIDADEETKKLQFRFNEQSKTPTWRRMARGSLPTYEDGIAKGGLPGKDVWAGLQVPVFLVAGEVDSVTKPGEIEKIAVFLGKSHPVQVELNEKSEPIVDAAAPVDTSLQRNNNDEKAESDNDFVKVDTFQTDGQHEDPSTPTDELSPVPAQSLHPKKILKTTVLPAPASHALLYQAATVRILAGLISDFLQTQVSARLSLGWQLQFLSTSGKWDVKNLAKWQAVDEVSRPIAGVFRAMKTLREVDEKHCPEVFVRNWGNQVKDIVDISHESPVYDPRGLEKGGVRYHKFPTVSKIPPTAEEVTAFIAVIDRLREELKDRAKQDNWPSPFFIGVHCHYGFNRTGYFLVCYMVERLGYDVQQAIDEFAKQRPKGIKHAHFLDQLFVRYCKGLKRAPTL